MKPEIYHRTTRNGLGRNLQLRDRNKCHPESNRKDSWFSCGFRAGPSAGKHYNLKNMIFLQDTLLVSNSSLMVWGIAEIGSATMGLIHFTLI